MQISPVDPAAAVHPSFFLHIAKLSLSAPFTVSMKTKRTIWDIFHRRRNMKKVFLANLWTSLLKRIAMWDEEAKNLQKALIKTFTCNGSLHFFPLPTAEKKTSF